MNPLPHASNCLCPACETARQSIPPPLSSYHYETKGYWVVAVAMIKSSYGTWAVVCEYRPKNDRQLPLPSQEYTLESWEKLCKRKKDW